MEKHYFTSESVTEGHPDKICDQISDGVLDAVLTDDPDGACCCEVFTTTGLVVVGGEITTKTYVDIPKIVRSTLKDIGYTDADYGIDYKSCGVMVAVDEQSPDIAQGEKEEEGAHKAQGAGDQGMMFGYASKETAELMPMPIMLAHGLTRKLAEVRKSNTLDYLRPDGKSQVTVEYSDGKPVRVDAVVVATQHNPDVALEKLREDVRREIIDPICGEFTDENTKYYINETGKFVIGGPQGDTGVTGRKIIVDTYGGKGRHGGGAFSGKVPNKQDRSGAYMARYIAKNIVAADLADECEVQLSYAIGYPEPTSVLVDTFGTGKVDGEKLTNAVREIFDLTPAGIIETLDLKRPIYKATASYGHFGRDEFPWEKIDKVEELKSKLSL
ncbi:MAG: methionine adenosyltransferase [Candidatus Magasanikbacteria bacterium]|jgi:S-adenosylmethionine synthetase|nr:methionine adenosyltransferase [Candidatus Magasanikbacteria bacterium]MBT4314683.1 methionine adenosyltransferase [Candidatus Magasanikbacteria bacterium]MBT4547262.1 methionine adenosyltransferase [Candidatus Magasanikbacteria bacterium]MBT6819123.1 methionine adenosyltransferase [Candidatus Magasanikbacteria bacterium]